MAANPNDEPVDCQPLATPKKSTSPSISQQTTPNKHRKDHHHHKHHHNELMSPQMQTEPEKPSTTPPIPNETEIASTTTEHAETVVKLPSHKHSISVPTVVSHNNAHQTATGELARNSSAAVRAFFLPPLIVVVYSRSLFTAPQESRLPAG